MRWVVVLALAAACFMSVAQQARRRFVVLTWSYPAGAAAVASFTVRGLMTNQLAAPSYEWPIVASTPAVAGRSNYSVALPIDKSAVCVWFVVTAVDTNGIESNFGW